MVPWHVDYFKLRVFGRWQAWERLSDLLLKPITRPSCEKCPPQTGNDGVALSLKGKDDDRWMGLPQLALSQCPLPQGMPVSTSLATPVSSSLSALQLSTFFQFLKVLSTLLSLPSHVLFPLPGICLLPDPHKLFTQLIITQSSAQAPVLLPQESFPDRISQIGNPCLCA